MDGRRQANVLAAQVPNSLQPTRWALSSKSWPAKSIAVAARRQYFRPKSLYDGQWNHLTSRLVSAYGRAVRSVPEKS